MSSTGSFTTGMRLSDSSSAGKFVTLQSDAARLVETAVDVATGNKVTSVLTCVLEWYKMRKEKVGMIDMLNVDCMMNATIQGDKEQVDILYQAGYRLGEDTTMKLIHDPLKKIKLFQAQSSPLYCSIAFLSSMDVESDDPLLKCLEYSVQANHYANTIQDFNVEYSEVERKCEDFATKLLNQCTTKNEIQTLLQTKSYSGHHDANFNIVILDGHKSIVAHEKFQQLLHKKWGQRDRVQYGDSMRYNVFWSEMGTLQKILHILKQAFFFPLLPIIFLLSASIPCFG